LKGIDLSGHWVLSLRDSVLSPVVAPKVRSGLLRIEHHEPRFKSHLTIVFPDKPVEAKFELLSDGRETVAEIPGKRVVSSLRWEEDVLVATCRIEGPGEAVTIAFRYELEDGGRRLRATEQLRGGGRDQDNLWVFERS
jgi:hypothetical protein